MKLFGLGAIMGAIVLSGQAIAITFGPTAVVDGNVYTIGGGVGANGIAVNKIGNSLSFALPNGFSLGSLKTLTLEYSVAASSGNFLTGINQISSNGVATGSANVSVETSFTGVTNEIAPSISYPAGSSFNPVSYSFSSQPTQWNSVKTAINLDGSGGLAKVSTYTANYQQAPVPEPVSVAVLASGIGALIIRRRGAKS